MGPCAIDQSQCRRHCNHQLHCAGRMERRGLRVEGQSNRESQTYGMARMLEEKLFNALLRRVCSR